jgi:hypothetical protein
MEASVSPAGTLLIRATVHTSPGLEADLFGSFPDRGEESGLNEIQADLEGNIYEAVLEVFSYADVKTGTPAAASSSGS